MAISVGASTSAVTASTTSFATSAITVGAGSGVYVSISQRYGTLAAVSSVVDSNGKTLTRIGTQITNGSDFALDRFYGANIGASASYTVTVTMASAISFAIFVLEMPGADLSAPLSQSNQAGGFGVVSPGSITIGANELMVSTFAEDNFTATIVFAESTGFTIQTQQAVGNTNQGDGALATWIPGAGTYNPSWAPTGHASVVINDSFLSGAAAAAPVPHMPYAFQPTMAQ